MAASVIDLDAARERRAAIQDSARTYMQDLAKFLVVESMAAASRAFVVADLARDSDPDLARDIFRAAHRRLRAKLRRRLGRPVQADMERQVMEQAGRVFRGRILQLQDKRDTRLANECAP